jgi:glycosyltransferase involved in cell wall biosynthesis
MKLVFISDKVCWPDKSSPTGYGTVGGFPYQMDTISGLFDQTRIVIMERKLPAPPNLMHLTGHNLSVHPFKEPPGEDWMRKISIMVWLIFNGRKLWLEIRGADVLHINVPGDLGGIAIFLGLLQKKRMFIRHCSTWDQPITPANHALLWLLVRIANKERNLVMATGWSEQSPSNRNPNITWIFSTTLHDEELFGLSETKTWRRGDTLKLITVGRLIESKNIQAIIEAIPSILQMYPDIFLRIVGDGPYKGMLKQLVIENHLDDIVDFTGNLDHAQVLHMLCDSHIFVFPSVIEGFPKAVLEAIACGLPVIATRVSAIPHMVRNGCGFLLQDATASSVAQAVIQLISDPTYMARMGELARKSAKGYTLEAWGGEIQMHLEKAWGPLRSSAG